MSPCNHSPSQRIQTFSQLFNRAFNNEFSMWCGAIVDQGASSGAVQARSKIGIASDGARHVRTMTVFVTKIKSWKGAHMAPAWNALGSVTAVGLVMPAIPTAHSSTTPTCVTEPLLSITTAPALDSFVFDRPRLEHTISNHLCYS